MYTSWDLGQLKGHLFMYNIRKVQGQTEIVEKYPKNFFWFSIQKVDFGKFTREIVFVRSN